MGGIIVDGLHDDDSETDALAGLGQPEDGVDQQLLADPTTLPGLVDSQPRQQNATSSKFSWYAVVA